MNASHENRIYLNLDICTERFCLVAYFFTSQEDLEEYTNCIQTLIQGNIDPEENEYDYISLSWYKETEKVLPTTFKELLVWIEDAQILRIETSII